MTSDDSAVIAALTEAVLAVDGVTEIYPVSPRLPAVVAAVGTAISVIRGAQTAKSSTVAVSRDDNGVQISAHIGVDASRATPVVTRDVSAVLEQTAARMLGSAVTFNIRVQVGSIG